MSLVARICSLMKTNIALSVQRYAFGVWIIHSKLVGDALDHYAKSKKTLKRTLGTRFQCNRKYLIFIIATW